MSLIATHLNKFGIALLSDSNLTDAQGNAGFGQKVFPIPHLNAGLAYSGTYTINGITVDTWMNEFITGSAFTAYSIEQFCSQLQMELNRLLRDNEFEIVTIIHIAGYHEEKDSRLAYLEHWHISNSRLLGTGHYDNPTSLFGLESDFNSRTNLDHRQMLINWDLNSTSGAQFYNGLPEGRMAYSYIQQVMENALNTIWTQYSDWNFRKPANIYETSSIIKLYFEFVLTSLN